MSPIRASLSATINTLYSRLACLVAVNMTPCYYNHFLCPERIVQSFPHFIVLISPPPSYYDHVFTARQQS